MRGEHEEVSDYEKVPLGSSPHARGTPVGEVAHDVLGGIIPACAGNTFVRAEVMAESGDHPRMRGEH